MIVLSCLGGCAQIPLGQAINHPEQKERLLDQSHPPHVTQVVFHTVLQWPGRALSLTEIVKVEDTGVMSVVGLSDMGQTLYAIRLPGHNEAELLKKNLPFSDSWLLEGLVPGLVTPWQRPLAHAELGRLADGSWRLLQDSPGGRTMFVFDMEGRRSQVLMLSGKRLVSRTTMEWDRQAVPLRMITENKRHHYRAIRERASIE